MGATPRFLRDVSKRLNACPPERFLVRSAPVKSARGRIDNYSRPSVRFLEKLLHRLDCNESGDSRRTGKPAWPESWDLARDVVAAMRADRFSVHVIACWLERFSPTTRTSYARMISTALRAIRVQRVRDLIELPAEAGLTWQREFRRELTSKGLPRLPRTINAATSAFNSLLMFCDSLGLRKVRWQRINPVPVVAGRHINRDAVVLTHDQLDRFFEAAAQRPQRQLLALYLAALHGLRRAEIAALRWRDFRAARRGQRPAPAILRVIGKGRRPRTVQVHPAIRGWMDRARRAQHPAAPILADLHDQPPTPAAVSRWAKATFRAAGLPEAYAHALRATWATLAVESKSNDLRDIQIVGGWKRMETMNDNYIKTRKTPLIRLVDAAG